MDAVCEDKEDEKHDLQSCEGCVGCNYDRGSWARCEDRGHKVGKEGCHSGWEDSLRAGRRGPRLLETASQRFGSPVSIFLGYRQDFLPSTLGGRKTLLLEFYFLFYLVKIPKSCLIERPTGEQQADLYPVGWQGVL